MIVACGMKGFRHVASGTVAIALGLSSALMALNGSAAAASKTTYVIGNIGTYSGPVSGDYNSDRQVLTAWQDYTNAHGGINGHKVKVISVDDQGSPSVGDQVAQELVQQDHVMAVIDNNSNVLGYQSPFEQAGIPLIGATSVPPPPSDLLYFPVGAGAVGITYGAIKSAVLQHKTKIAFLYCTNAAVCSQEIPLVKTDAKIAGATTPYIASAPETAPNYTSYCIAAKQKGVQAIYTALASPAIIAIAQSCAEQGYHPTFLLPGAPVGPTFAKVTAANGLIGVEGVFPWVSDSTPAEKTFHAAIDKYARSILSSQTYNATTANSWADAQMFALAASHMKGDSSAALVDALRSLKNVTLGGLIGPQSYSAVKQIDPTCFSRMELEKGHFVALDGGKFICPPTSS